MLAVHAVNLLQPIWPNYNTANPSHLRRFAAAASEMTLGVRVPTLDWPSDLFVDVDATAEDSQVDRGLPTKIVLCSGESVLSTDAAESSVSGETNYGLMIPPYHLSCGTTQAEITT